VSARLRSEDGFSLVEVLTAMTVGLAVLAAAFQLVGYSTTLTKATQDRVDATQRGRQGLEAVTTSLRSTVCVTDGTQKAGPIVSASGSRVDFYANTGRPNDPPQLRSLQLTGTTITLTSTPATAKTTPVGAITLPVAGTATTTALVENAVPIDASTPVFRFMTYNATDLENNTLTALDLGNPVAATDLPKMLWVEVNFRVRPLGATANSSRDAIFKGKAYFRAANPMQLTDDDNPNNGISC
jgi:prepilin-type N-terminal cleavage/methylation domain-containing protein